VAWWTRPCLITEDVPGRLLEDDDGVGGRVSGHSHHTVLCTGVTSS
jgi:hypothetical protein